MISNAICLNSLSLAMDQLVTTTDIKCWLLQRSVLRNTQLSNPRDISEVKKLDKESVYHCLKQEIINKV